MRTLSLSLLAFSACTNAQVVFQTIYNGPQGYAAGSALIQTADGGYAVVGTTSGNGIFDGLLVRFDPIGDTLWSHTYDFGGYDFLTSLFERPDGGFMLGGHIAYEGLLLIRTDADGDTLWTHIYPAPSGWQQGSDMRWLANGGMVLTSESSVDQDTPADMLWVAVDENGAVLGGTNTEGGPWREAGRSVAQTANGGLVIVGEQRLHAEDSLNLAIWLYDNNFQIIASMSYGVPEQEDMPDNITAVGYAVEPCQAGGFIVAGMVTDSITGDTDAVFIRVSQNFQFLWTLVLGDDGRDIGSDVAECGNGNFSLLWSSSDEPYGTWMITVVDESGQEISTTAYGNAEDYTSGSGIIANTDGEPVVTGTFIDGGIGSSAPDLHLTKVNGSCYSVSVPEPADPHESMSIWPSPFTDLLNIAVPKSSGPHLLSITDPLGRTVLRRSLSSSAVTGWTGSDANGTEVPSGVYFITIIADGQHHTQRVVKQ